MPRQVTAGGTASPSPPGRQIAPLVPATLQLLAHGWPSVTAPDGTAMAGNSQLTSWLVRRCGLRRRQRWATMAAQLLALDWGPLPRIFSGVQGDVLTPAVRQRDRRLELEQPSANLNYGRPLLSRTLQASSELTGSARAAELALCQSMPHPAHSPLPSRCRDGQRLAHVSPCKHRLAVPSRCA